MAHVMVLGRITADPEQKTSQNNHPYMRFDLAENTASQGRPTTQYYQVWAWGEDVTRLMKAKVKKDSYIYVTGTLFLDAYLKSDGVTTDKRLRINLSDWGYVPTGKRREETNALPETPLINGDKEILPE